jgi:hypothetical protein
MMKAGIEEGLASKHLEQQRKRLLERPGEGGCIGRHKGCGRSHQERRSAITRAPAIQRCENVIRRDRRAIMEDKTVAERERIGQAVVGLRPACHLRLNHALCVHRHELVIDHVAMVAGNVGWAQDRVEDPQAGMHDRRDGPVFGMSRHRRQGYQHTIGASVAKPLSHSGSGAAKAMITAGSPTTPGIR